MGKENKKRKGIKWENVITIKNTFITLVISLPLCVKVFANSAAEAQRKVEAEEEERLAKIRASMTPAEWETYKIQLENNKLLKNIQRNNNSKRTTTSIGFVE